MIRFFGLGTSTFAAISQTQIKNYSSKLEANRTKLLQGIDSSKVKLKNVAQEVKFSDTSLFKAANLT